MLVLLPGTDALRGARLRNEISIKHAPRQAGVAATLVTLMLPRTACLQPGLWETLRLHRVSTQSMLAVGSTFAFAAWAQNLQPAH